MNGVRETQPLQGISTLPLDTVPNHPIGDTFTLYHFPTEPCYRRLRKCNHNLTGYRRAWPGHVTGCSLRRLVSCVGNGYPLSVLPSLPDPQLPHLAVMPHKVSVYLSPMPRLNRCTPVNQATLECCEIPRHTPQARRSQSPFIAPVETSGTMLGHQTTGTLKRYSPALESPS